MAFVLLQRAGQSAPATQGREAPAKPQGARYRLISRGSQGAPSPQTDPNPAKDMGPQTVNTAGKSDRELSGMEYASDIGQSALSGLRSGVEQLVGLPGDAQRLSGSVVGWAADKLGASPETKARAEWLARRAVVPASVGDFPSSQDVGQATDAVIGERYTPQTTAGDYARTIGEFAPSAIAGPGGVGRKVAMTVVPALASEVAGQFTEGTAAEPYARAAGAIAGGGAAAGFKGATKNAALKEAAKSTADLQATKNAAYDFAESTIGKTKMEPQIFRKMVLGMNSVSAQRGGGSLSSITDSMRLNSKKLTADLSNKLREVFRGNAPAPTYGEIEDLRQTISADLNKMVGQNGKLTADGEMMARLRDKLDEAVMATPFKEAREAYRTLRKTERIDAAIFDASTRAASEDLAFKNEFRKIMRENRKTKMFNKTEMEAIGKVFGHLSKGNLLEAVGKLGFTSKSVVGPTISGIMTGGVVPLVATPVRAIGTQMTKNAAGRARDIVALGEKKLSSVNKQLIDERARRMARRLQITVTGTNSQQPQQ